MIANRPIDPKLSARYINDIKITFERIGEPRGASGRIKRALVGELPRESCILPFSCTAVVLQDLAICERC